MAFAPAQGSGSATGAAATQVQGTANDGAAELGNPVQVGGVDGSGNAQALSVDTSGRADVNLVSGQSAITAGAGAVAANTPRVTLASDDPAVASLSVLDDWDETNRAAVNLIASQAGITGGAGAVAANTPRATLASDDPAVTALQGWDEADRAKVNPVVGQAGVAAGTGLDAANALRVSLATDVALPTGSNIVGRVGVDQTTPGTTDSVSVATGQGAGATIGTAADASVPTDAAGTLSGKMRGVVANLATTLTRLGAAADAKSGQDAEASLHAKARAVVDLLFQVDAVLDSITTRLPAALGQTTMANALPVVLASIDDLQIRIADLNADIGNTTDAAVKDATGSVNAHLRGLSTQLPQVLGATTAAQSLSVAPASAANIAAAQVSVGVASQEIVAARAARRSMSVRNLGTAAEKVYLGAGTVTNANGFLIEAGESIEIESTAAVNGIADGTTVSCSYLEVY